MDLRNNQSISNSLERFGAWFKEGFDLYKENAVLLIGASGLAIVLSQISLGLLSGPAALGVYLLVFQLLRKSSPPPHILNMFDGKKGSSYLHAFALSIFWLLVILLADYALRSLVWSSLACGFSVLFSLAIHSTTILALPLIADREMTFFDASLESVDLIKKDFLSFYVFASLGLLCIVWAPTLLRAGMAEWFSGLIIGSILLPLYFCTVGIIYQKLVPPLPTEAQETEKNDDEITSN